jgi:flagellar hook-associated protein 3 FlgL
VSDVGSRRNTLSTQQSINEETKLRLETTLSDVKDVDYAQKVTEMQTQMMLLQAAQSSFSQISQLSLWNYLD